MKELHSADEAWRLSKVSKSWPLKLISRHKIGLKSRIITKKWLLIKTSFLKEMSNLLLKNRSATTLKSPSTNQSRIRVYFKRTNKHTQSTNIQFRTIMNSIWMRQSKDFFKKTNSLNSIIRKRKKTQSSCFRLRRSSLRSRNSNHLHQRWLTIDHIIHFNNSPDLPKSNKSHRTGKLLQIFFDRQNPCQSSGQMKEFTQNPINLILEDKRILLKRVIMTSHFM